LTDPQPIDPTKPISAEEAGELLGVSAERIRQRIAKGQLTGIKGADGKWSVALDGKMLELAEAARLRLRAKPAPSPDPIGAPIGPPTNVGVEEIPPAEGVSTAKIGRSRVQPKKRPRLEPLGASEPTKLGAPTARPPSAAAGALKFTPAKVERAMIAGFGVVAQIKHAPHWRVTHDELADFSTEVADLVNSLPPSLVTAGVGLSGVTTIAVGLFGIVYARMAVDAVIAAQGQQQQTAGALSAVERFLAGAMGGPQTGEVVTEVPSPGPQGPRAAAPVAPQPHAGIGGMFGGLAS
jgi:hypothetical protein